MTAFEFYNLQVCPVIYAMPVSQAHLDSMKHQARETTALYHLASERAQALIYHFMVHPLDAGTGGTSELFKAIFIKGFLS